MDERTNDAEREEELMGIPLVGEERVDVESVEAPRAMPQDATVDLRRAVAEFEAQLIRRALEQSNGVVSRAAALLRLPRTTLVEKLIRLKNATGATISGESRPCRVPRTRGTAATQEEIWL